MSASLRRAAFAVALFVSVAAAPKHAHATVLHELSFDGIVRESDLVVVATPEGRRATYWLHGRIVTDVTVTVSTTLKGAPLAGTRVVVRLPGGVVGHLGQTIAGAPVLLPNAPVVLFLTRPREGARTVVSFAAGELPMTVTADGTVNVLPARTEGITFLPVARAVGERPMPTSPVALPALAAWVREATR